MKHKICISIQEETLKQVLEGVRKGRFRNKSHAFEYAISRLEVEG